MTPSQLAKVETGKFVGEYKVREKGGDKVPLLAISMGKLPETVADQAGSLALENADIYRIDPITDGGTTAVAAIEDVKKESDGHIAARLKFAVGGDPTALHNESLTNPLLEGAARFSRVLSLLTETDHVDRLYMDENDTNLTRDEINWLGFQAVGSSDVYRLDLEPMAA